MKKLQKVLGTMALGATLGLAGCKSYLIVCSDMQHETGKVVNKQSWGIGNLSSHEIVIEGKKQYFTINQEDVYNQLKIGDSVRVDYRERYRLTFDDTNNDGYEEFLGRKLIGNSVVNLHTEK